ncbi:MAG: lysophospholipid acyltransferase family protein [Desulfobacterales bacterium]
MKNSPLQQNVRPAKHPPGRNKGFLQVFKFLVRILLLPFFHLETDGLHNLPRESAFILLPKHQRWEDIPLLGLATPRPLYYIAKYELFKNALSHWFFSAMGGIPLNRQRPLESRRYLQATIQLLEKGEGVVIFPEGTYYRNKMGPGQTGMVRFVLSRLKLPFIPVGINYAVKGWRTHVRINFGKAFHSDPTLAADAFVSRMMREIAALSGLSLD